MFNINELNEYVENFGTVVKKLDKISEINDKVESVSDAQKETDKAMREQWEKTIPIIDSQIKELKEMVTSVENTGMKQEAIIRSMDNSILDMQSKLNDSLENAVKTLDLKFETQKQELLALKNDINNALVANANKQQMDLQAELQTNQGKLSKQQIIVLVVVVIGIVLDIVLKFI